MIFPKSLLLIYMSTYKMLRKEPQQFPSLSKKKYREEKAGGIGYLSLGSGKQVKGEELRYMLEHHLNAWPLRGTWAAQSVKHLAFSSGHDPRVLGWGLTSGSLLSRESASLSPSASPPACVCALSLSLSER